MILKYFISHHEYELCLVEESKSPIAKKLKN